MRRLMLLRHAKAETGARGQRDVDRALAPRGRAVAPLVGSYLAAQGLLPDHVVISSARRTRETWEGLAPALPQTPSHNYEPRVYEAAPKALLAVIHEAPAQAHTLLLIGHNPGLQDLAILLTGSGDDDARHRMREKFSTAALAVLDFAIDDWKSLAPSSGRLDRFATSRMLNPDAD